MPARRYSQRRSNNNALGCFGLIAFLFCAGIFGNHGSSITNTISNPPPTAQSLAYVAPTATPILPTATALPPKATAGPGVGSTQTLDGWVISLARAEIWPQLPFTSKAGKIQVLESDYWLLWVDVRNTGKQAASLSTLQWTLENEAGNGYDPQGPEPKYGTLDAFIHQQGRDLLTAPLKSGALAHPLLVFNPDPSLHVTRLAVATKQTTIYFALPTSAMGARATATAVVLAALEAPPLAATPTRDLAAELAHIYATRTATARAVQTEIAGGGTYGGVRIGAICTDGWRSSATGRGACSHHGGVAQWLTSP